jgi:hypothetical protein
MPLFDRGTTSLCSKRYHQITNISTCKRTRRMCKKTQIERRFSGLVRSFPRSAGKHIVLREICSRGNGLVVTSCLREIWTRRQLCHVIWGMPASTTFSWHGDLETTDSEDFSGSDHILCGGVALCELEQTVASSVISLVRSASTRISGSMWCSVYLYGVCIRHSAA